MMDDAAQSLSYEEGSDQMLRALYEWGTFHQTAFASYDFLVGQGDVAPNFRWVRRFLDEMEARGFIKIDKSSSPKDGWGMVIQPEGRSYVEAQLRENPTWGKPLKQATGYGQGGYGQGGYGGGSLENDSLSEGSLTHESRIKTPSEPSAGNVISATATNIDVSAGLPGIGVSAPEANVDTSQWTGMQSRAVRLAVVRDLIPPAQEAITQMIAQLSQQGDNGGPKLDEDKEAIEALRGLHAALGEILAAIDTQAFNDELGEGLFAEAIRYGKRAAASVKHDPMRYATATLVFAILTACGAGEIGGLVAGYAAGIQKPKPA